MADWDPRCRLCEQADTQPWLSAKGHAIGRCGSCGFAQVLDVPTDEELASLYHALHTKHLKYRSTESARLENQRRVELVAKHVAPGARLLDAGCASGDFLAEASDRFEGHGVDISPAAIEHAAERLPALRSRLSAQRLEDFESEWPPFDAICLWDVIEHVPSPVSVTERLMAHLKPGGLLILSTPDLGSRIAQVMRSNWPFMIPPYHLGYFSRRSITHLFTHRVPAEILAYETRGKSVAIAFLLYKLNQMSPWLAPQRLLDWVANQSIGRVVLEVPTNDIAYVVARKH